MLLPCIHKHCVRRWLFLTVKGPLRLYCLYSISSTLENKEKGKQVSTCYTLTNLKEYSPHNPQTYTHKQFHNRKPFSCVVRIALVILWLASPALSFPSNQLQSVAGMEGEITLGRHRVEISAQPRHYLVLPKHLGCNLCQTTRLQLVHTGPGGG